MHKAAIVTMGLMEWTMEYFETNGVEPTRGLLKELPSEEGVSDNVVVLTTFGPRYAYYSHKDDVFAVIETKDEHYVFETVEILSQKVIVDVETFKEEYNKMFDSTGSMTIDCSPEIAQSN